MIAVLMGCQNPSVNPTLAIEPLPQFLGVVIPGPGESNSLEEYNNLASTLGWNATEPAVCFSVQPSWVMESGDIFASADQWLLDRVHIVIDDTAIIRYHSLLLTDSVGLQATEQSTGKIAWKAPDGSPLRVCYALPLEVGVHTATIVIEKTSGEQVTYTWQFRITE